MNAGAWLLLSVIMSSLLTGMFIFALPEEWRRTRSVANLAGAMVKLIIIGAMLWGVYDGAVYELRFPFAPGYDLLFRADALALLFMTLSAVLWLLTTIYAIGYLEASPNRSRFFGFFSMCVTATMGIALAGNLITFFLFYELLTLSTYPLVVHRGTTAALRAGNVYLAYTLTGGAALLVGIVWLQSFAGTVEFQGGGLLAELDAVHHEALIAIFVLLIAGLGVKSALVPLHGWLPVAMVAPAPVSALLHAVAVVKAGAFGIVRVVYEVYGIEFASSLGVLTVLGAVAAATILYGSLRALMQTDIKKRLAYSTVSQVSYIVLGVSVLGPIATVGGLVHLVHQGIMKITLFFCAGNLAETLEIHKVNELDGVGRRMPLTMAAFTVAAFGMIGTPPLAGFISKWYLGRGAIEADQLWVIAVLAVSGLLNAAYFLPMVYAAWFKPPAGTWIVHRHGKRETSAWLLWPTIATGALTALIGILAGTAFSPLEWARLIAVREYRQ
jgi:multicomponent Na+:H+ antiporter subunit D